MSTYLSPGMPDELVKQSSMFLAIDDIYSHDFKFYVQFDDKNVCNGQ